MKEYPVPEPTSAERAMFDALTPKAKPAYEVFYSTGLIGRRRYEPEVPRPSDIHNPDDWDNWLTSSVRGEWYAYVLRDCEKVLDIGSGGGFPSLYIARTIPEVVGIEPGRCEIEGARETTNNFGYNNVTFLQENALDLPFEDNSFEGACFCTSLESTGDAHRALQQARRVVKPDGVVAIELAPFAFYLRGHDCWERTQLYVTDDEHNNPLVNYWVMTANPITERRYQIYLKPASYLGKAIRKTILNAEDSPQITSDEILERIMKSQFEMIESIEYFCVYGFEPQELRSLLTDIGFKDIAYWTLPSGPEFAKALHDEGLLQGLNNNQLIPYLKALVRCSKTHAIAGNHVKVINEK